LTRLGIPEPNKLSPLLLNLDLRRLNSLESRDLSQIIETLDKKKRDGSFETIESRKVRTGQRGDGEYFSIKPLALRSFRLALVNAADLTFPSKSEVVVQPRAI
jgi:hypothetical protein